MSLKTESTGLLPAIVYQLTVMSRGDLVAHQFADDLHLDGKPRPSSWEEVKSDAGICLKRRRSGAGHDRTREKPRRTRFCPGGTAGGYPRRRHDIGTSRG